MELFLYKIEQPASDEDGFLVGSNRMLIEVFLYKIQLFLYKMELFLYKIKHPMKMVLVGKLSDAGKRLRSSVRLSDCGKQCALCRAHRDVYNVKCALYTQ